MPTIRLAFLTLPVACPLLSSSVYLFPTHSPMGRFFASLHSFSPFSLSVISVHPSSRLIPPWSHSFSRLVIHSFAHNSAHLLSQLSVWLSFHHIRLFSLRFLTTSCFVPFPHTCSPFIATLWLLLPLVYLCPSRFFCPYLILLISSLSFSFFPSAFFCLLTFYHNFLVVIVVRISPWPCPSSSTSSAFPIGSSFMPTP